jgi:cell division protein ZipA
MSGRELVILILGFAIIAVILRGLYVAIQARRSQIKLAIDKNIPQNVDLEALEMAELPGGGARVVTRSLEEVNRQNSALDSAQHKAEALDLGEEDEEQQIPMLMDAVEVADQQGELEIDEPCEDDPVYNDHEEQDSWQDEEVEQGIEESFSREVESFGDGTNSFGDEEDINSDDSGFSAIANSNQQPQESYREPGEEYREAGVVHEQATNTNTHEDLQSNESADDVLLDYGDDSFEEDAQPEDNLSSVMPDYDNSIEEDDYADEEQRFEGSHDHIPENDWQDEVASEVMNEEEVESQQAAASNFEDHLGEFSMTAGERIGQHPSLGSEESQSTLFDDEEMTRPARGSESGVSKSGLRSLFSAFGRKSKTTVIEKPQRAEAAEPIERVEPAAVQQAHFEEPQQEDLEDVIEQAEEQAHQLAVESGEEVAPFLRQATEVDARDELAGARAKPETAEPVTEASEVLVINVMAREGRVFAGSDLLQVLITSGLKFGDMNIFHKRLSNDSTGPIIFSVANALNPGVFDLNKMEQFTTLGISLFLALPTPINNLDGFEQMLDTAQQIRGALDGELKDDHRNGMTAQTIEHYRQRVRDFELRRLKTAGARG